MVSGRKISLCYYLGNTYNRSRFPPQNKPRRDGASRSCCASDHPLEIGPYGNERDFFIQHDLLPDMTSFSREMLTGDQIRDAFVDSVSGSGPARAMQ